MRTADLWTILLVLGLVGCRPAPAETPKVEGPELLKMLADEDIFLLDVREPSELEEFGTVEGYVNIPVGELADRLDEIPKDKRILTA
jgi:hypothetical protein